MTFDGLQLLDRFLDAARADDKLSEAKEVEHSLDRGGEAHEGDVPTLLGDSVPGLK